MKLLLSSLLAFTSLTLGPVQTPQKPVPLFDGRTFTGWEGDTLSTWRIQDGAIVGGSLSTQVPRNEFLTTTRSFGDFVLRVKFKLIGTEGFINGGVQIRSQAFDKPRVVKAGKREIKIPAGRVHGYQVEIDPSARAYSGGIYDEGRRGWLADLKDNEKARKAFKQKEWNQFRIECKGDRIRTWINGVPAADLKDSVTPSGFIALQVHGVGKRADPLEVRWRKIRLKELK